MRYSYVVAVLLLIGCEQKAAKRQETAHAPLPTPPLAAAPSPAAPLLTDTAQPYRQLPGFGDSLAAAPVVQLNGATYRLETTVATDSTQPVSYLMPRPDASESDTARGFEGYYTFRLLRPNGEPQFVRKLKKSDFGGAMGQDLVVESEAALPVFAGYLPAFNALAFEVSLYPPESDAGGQALLLLDARTGQVLHKALSRWTGGCNSPMALSTDGRVLLTSAELLQAHGPITKLDKPGRLVAGTLLVNDQTALIVYASGYDKHGREVPLTGRNAELIGANGRVLKSFNLESIDGGLGNQMLSHYAHQTRTHYLFDETNGQLGLVTRDNPTQLRVVKLKQMSRFRAPQRPTEVRVHFKTELGTEATFYEDTSSKQLRYELRKPAY